MVYNLGGSLTSWGVREWGLLDDWMAAALRETPVLGVGMRFCKIHAYCRRAGKPGSTAGKDARRHGGLRDSGDGGLTDCWMSGFVGGA